MATRSIDAHPTSRHITTLAHVAVAAIALTAFSSATAETRGYAISLIYTASYQSPDNCPKGGNGGPKELKTRILMSRGYTREKALEIIGNDDTDEKGNRVDFRMRGSIDGKPASVTTFPQSYPDPHVETAVGRFAYGFDLDGKTGPDSFEDPETHQQGVDNQMWRVLGCFANYWVRRPVIPYNESIVWDTAMDSMPAWLMSISGDDLSKDGAVTVTFDRALNILMRDARGAVLPGSSYTIDEDPRSHRVFKGQLANGVVTVEPGEFFMQGESQFYALLRLNKAQLRVYLKPNGNVYAVLGGYQPWLDYYHYLAIRGEGDGLVDLPGVYNAMKRLADANPDPATGLNRDISAAYYIEAAPVFHTSVDGRVVGTAWFGEPGAPPPQHSSSATNDKEKVVARQ